MKTTGEKKMFLNINTFVAPLSTYPEIYFLLINGLHNEYLCKTKKK